MVLIGSQWFGAEAAALPATASFITSYNTTTNASTYTLAASDFGSPTLAAGKLVFTLSGRGGAATWNTPTAVTESGNALTLVADQVSGYNGAAVYQLDDRGGGALGEVVFTFGADMGAIIVGLYMITGTTTEVAAMVATSTAAPLSADLDIPALGAAVGVGETENAATATWANLPEDYDTTNADTIGSGASVTDEDGSRPTVTCTWTSSANPALCLASWGPAVYPANTDIRHTRSGSVYTFSDCLLGGPGTKKIVVAVQPFNGGPFSFSATVGGSSATQIVSQGSHNYDYYSSLFYIDSITASKGDIVVTTGVISGVMIGVYCIIGAASGTAYDTDTYQTTTAITSQAISLDIPAGGCAIACAANAGSVMGTSSVYGWTNLTENYDRWEESPYTLGSAASGYFTEEQSGLTITAAITGNTGINAGTNSMAGASFAPA